MLTHEVVCPLECSPPNLLKQGLPVNLKLVGLARLANH